MDFATKNAWVKNLFLMTNNLQGDDKTNFIKNLCLSPNVSADVIQSNITSDWDWQTLSGNYNITLELISSTKDNNWNWKKLSDNNFITWEFISQNIDLNWDWKILTYKKFITLDIILNDLYKNKDWDWNYISSTLPLTWDNIDSNRNKINFKSLTRNPNITLEIISAHPNEDWDYNFLPYKISIPVRREPTITELTKTFLNK